MTPEINSDANTLGTHFSFLSNVSGILTYNN